MDYSYGADDREWLTAPRGLLYLFQLRRERPRFDAEGSTWVGTLPSGTEFGEATLTPGDRCSFDIGFENGALVPERDGRTITDYRRRTLLETHGWSYIVKDDGETGRSNTRVADY